MSNRRFVAGLWIVALCGLAGAAPGQDERLRLEVVASDRPWLGVYVSDAVDGGVEIVAVVPGSPAERADLRRGDVVLAASGRVVANERELGRLLEQFRPGDTMNAEVLRGGRTIELAVPIGARPTATGLTVERASIAPEVARSRAAQIADSGVRAWLSREMMGIDVTSVTSALREFYGAPADAGVLVTRVEPGRLAHAAGIEVGDLLVGVGEVEIADPPQLQRLLLRWSGEQPLEARLVRNRVQQIVRLAPPPPTEAPRPPLASQALARQQVEAERARRGEQDRELLEQRLTLEIERLKRRLGELEQELERLREAGKPDEGRAPQD